MLEEVVELTDQLAVNQGELEEVVFTTNQLLNLFLNLIQ
jgi:hypothetical protein